MNRTVLISAAVALALLVAVSRADIEVGSKPTLRFKTTDGKVIENDSIRGWITIVYFWETDDKYTLPNADTLVPKYDAYGRRGAKLIPVVLNRDLGELEKQTKKNKLDWLQAWDGQGWKSATIADWGISSAPRAFILAPSGEVLWSGHPSAIDGPIEDAFRDHPPQISKEAQTELTARQIKEIIRILDSKKDDQDYREPLRQLGLLQSPPLADPEVLLLVKKLLPYFESKKEQDRNSLKGYLETYKDGARMLTAMRAAVTVATSQPGGNLSSAQLAQIQKRNQLAQVKLAGADTLKQGNKDVAAYRAYKQVVAAFSGTPAAKTAAESLKSFDGDAAFLARYKKSEQEESAASLLHMANTYRDNGHPDLAKSTYQQILDQYPDAVAASDARASLDKK